MIDIKGLDKAAVLAALYNSSKAQGMGLLQAKPGSMTVEDARKCLTDGDDRTKMFPGIHHRTLYFDYLYGRVLKVNLSGNEFSERLYDRDIGHGAAAAAINQLRDEGDKS